MENNEKTIKETKTELTDLLKKAITDTQNYIDELSKINLFHTDNVAKSAKANFYPFALVLVKDIGIADTSATSIVQRIQLADMADDTEYKNTLIKIFELYSQYRELANELLSGSEQILKNTSAVNLRSQLISIATLFVRRVNSLLLF